MDPKKIGISEDLKYRYLGDTGISKNRAARHPSGGPAGQVIAFETRDNLSVHPKGLGKDRVRERQGWEILKTRAQAQSEPSKHTTGDLDLGGGGACGRFFWVPR